MYNYIIYIRLSIEGSQVRIFLVYSINIKGYNENNYQRKRR